MKKATYPLTPRNVSKHAWFYEGRRGIDVVAQLRDGDRVIGTALTLISWKHAYPVITHDH